MKNTQELISELLELSKAATQYIKNFSTPESENRLLWRCNDEDITARINTLLNSICLLEDRRSLKLEDVQTDNKWEAVWVYYIFHHLTSSGIPQVEYKNALALTFPNKKIATFARNALRVVLHPEYLPTFLRPLNDYYNIEVFDPNL